MSWPRSVAQPSGTGIVLPGMKADSSWQPPRMLTCIESTPASR